MLRELTGWMYLLSGVALLGAATLIPAAEELDRAQSLRDKALVQVEQRREMLAACGERLAALAEPDETLLHSLAQTHLNLGPAGASPLVLTVRGEGFSDVRRAAAVTPRVTEPPPADEERSPLAHLTTTPPARGLTIVFGAVCVLGGLLPPSVPKASHAASC